MAPSNEVSAADRYEGFLTSRTYRCGHGHEFTTIETHPSVVSVLGAKGMERSMSALISGAKRRMVANEVRTYVLRRKSEKASNSKIAGEAGVTEARVRQIVAADTERLIT